ncbi:hypothetical protein [Oceanobacillus sp. FSL H7-0719]|uniref:hypothetical protein n=1 Tax=Oceanobacillus sp. FSL H7-0719 TaxID=2954507 RepID=UPI00324D0C17
MINESLINDLLDKVDETTELINKHEVEELEDIKHGIYDALLSTIGVEDGFEEREGYYELLFAYEVKLIDREELINKIKLHLSIDK